MAVPVSLMPVLIHLHEAKLNAKTEEEAWQPLDRETFPYHKRTPLLNTGLIESRGDNYHREYRITHFGVDAVLEGGMPATHVPDEQTVSLVRESISLYPEPAKPCREKQPSGDCQECIYRDVVELLAAKQPQVLELVQALETTRRIRKELGI